MTKKSDSQVFDLHNQICTEVDWVKTGKFREIIDIKIELMNKYPFEMLSKVEQFVLSLRESLGYRIDSYARLKKLDNYLNFGQNDSDSDCLAEIVSMGYEKYLEFHKNPQMVIDYYESDIYRECFSYCFPFSDDYNPKYQESYGKLFYRKLKKDIKFQDI